MRRVLSRFKHRVNKLEAENEKTNRNLAARKLKSKSAGSNQRKGWGC